MSHLPRKITKFPRVTLYIGRRSWWAGSPAICVVFGWLVLMTCASALAQQQVAPPANSGWQSDTKPEPKAAAPATPSGNSGWSNPSNVTVVPRAAPETPSNPALGEVTVSALISDDGEPIEQGIIWRVFQPVPSVPGTAPVKPRLVGSWKDSSPVLKLAPGEYLVNASYGRAHLTRKIEVTAGTRKSEQFVLNAGGLRVSALLSNNEPAPPNSVTYDLYAGEGDQTGAGTKIVAGAKPGPILRLNAGIYQIVSTYGDTNAIVRGDVTVEAGKLSEAVVHHQAARVTLKLVPRAGGEAIADTQWILQTPQGETIRESLGALPSHILAAGRYVVIARNSGKVYKREFTVAAGDPLHVEVVME